MEENWLISIGDETADPDKIPESYQHAKDNLQLHQFYGEKINISFLPNESSERTGN